MNAKAKTLTQEVNPQDAVVPTYIRLPERGTTCPHTGLTRSLMESLIRPNATHPTPPVKSCAVSTDGVQAQRGARLVNYRSLMDYLASCETKKAEGSRDV